MDSQTLPYHWDDRARLYSDHQYLTEVYERYLAALYPRLNHIHRINQSERFWRVVVGPWLQYFIEIFYDRYLSIRAAAETGSVTDTLIGDVARESAPLDFSDFNRQFTSDSYNQYLYSWIIEQTKCVPFRVSSQEGPYDEKASSRPTTREVISIWLSRIGHAVPADWNRVSLITTQLPHSALIQLNRALGQFPWLAAPAIPVRKLPPNRDMRQGLMLQQGADSFEQLLDRIIPQQIPVAHVESFAELQKASLRSFPAEPKVIVTSAAEAFDEGFKVWAATQVDKGATLSISQHGGFFGSGRWISTENHQLKISRHYYSWGWSDEAFPSIKPMPALKLVGVKKRIRWSGSGQILWALTSIPRYSYRMLSIPVAGQFAAYLEDQFRFARALPAEIQRKITLRLYPHDYGWNEERRWGDQFPNLRVHKGNVPMDDELSESSLFIGTYNATTFLETLAADFPTLIFWNPKHWELRRTAEPFYDHLRDAGIFHTTPESAANKLEEIWADPMKWWKTANVQQVRAEFCDRFARTSENWIQDWKSELSR